MDIDVQNKFITAFQERMNFFIPRFEELYEKKNLLKFGQRSTLNLYWNKMNNIHYVVKEINLKQDSELEWIQKMIDSFFIIDTQVCNKKNVVKSEGFYYKFNRNKMSSNANMQSSQPYVTIDFYMVLEKCDGSLDELFNLLLNSNTNINSNANSKENFRKNSNTAAAKNNKNKSPKLANQFVYPSTEKNNSSILQKNQLNMQNECIDQQYQHIAGNADQAQGTSLKKEDLKIRLEDIDFFNLYSNLKDLILQIHELDGSMLYIESFDLSDIMFCYTNNNEIDLKFSKITTQQYDSKQSMRFLVEIILQIGLGNQFNFMSYNEQNQQLYNQQQIYPINQQSILLLQHNNNMRKNSKEINNQSNSNICAVSPICNSNDCHNANQNTFSSHQEQYKSFQNHQIPHQNNIKQGQNQNCQNQSIQQNNSQIQNNNQCQNHSYCKNISSNQNKSLNQIYLQNQNFSQNTTHAFFPNNQSLNISQNSSPSSHTIKVQQPVFSNSVSFKDVEQRVQNCNNQNLNQSQNMQMIQAQSPSACLISGSSSCNQIANPLANSINQDHCIEDINLTYQQQYKELLLDNVNLLKKKFQRDEILTTVTKFCKLIESMIKGQSINQCYYQILKIYNAQEFFFEFNQSKLSFINPKAQSLSIRNTSNAQLLFIPPSNVLRPSDCNRARSIFNDKRNSSSSSSSQNKKRNSMQRNQIQENVDAITTFINSLKDDTTVTLVQNFSNLVNAIKSKKKKIRFEKYLTVKEMRFLKTIDPSFCAVNCVSVDFGNFYQSEAMKLTADCFESLTNLQGLDLNFDYWNETSEDQFTYMIQKLSNLTNLRLFIASLSYIGQKNNYHSPNFAKNSIQAISQFLENMPELICLELDLTGWSTLKPEEIGELVNSIKKCNKLQQIQLVFNDIVTSSNQTIKNDTLMLFTQLCELQTLQQLQLSLRGWTANKRISGQNLLDFVCEMSQLQALNQGVQISFENLHHNMMEMVNIDEEVIKANLQENNWDTNPQKILQEIQQQLPNIYETLQQTKSITLTYQNAQIFILL